MSLDPTPVAPTDLPPVLTGRPVIVVRYSIDEDLVPHLKAVLNPAETVVRRPAFAKEYQL